MRELSEIIKEKVVRLFLAGNSYDEITRQLDIAKGSVTNIIDEFREGQISIPNDMAEYVNELRRIAVDLKKHQVSLNQLRSYRKVHTKLQEMNANGENIEKWLDLLHIIAASDPSSENYIDIIGWIADVSAETGKDCKEILDEYAEKLGYWDYINGEIDGKKEDLEKLRDEYTTESERINKQIAAMKMMLKQTEEVYDKQRKEMEARFQDFLVENSFSWGKVKTIMAAMDEKLIQAGLPSKELKAFYEKLQRAGSLFKIVQQLESEANKLRMDMEHLKKVEDQQWHEIYKLSSFS